MVLFKSNAIIIVSSIVLIIVSGTYAAPNEALLQTTEINNRNYELCLADLAIICNEKITAKLCFHHIFFYINFSKVTSVNSKKYIKYIHASLDRSELINLQTFCELLITKDCKNYKVSLAKQKSLIMQCENEVKKQFPWHLTFAKLNRKKGSWRNSCFNYIFYNYNTMIKLDDEAESSSVAAGISRQGSFTNSISNRLLGDAEFTSGFDLEETQDGADLEETQDDAVSDELSILDNLEETQDSAGEGLPSDYTIDGAFRYRLNMFNIVRASTFKTGIDNPINDPHEWCSKNN